MIRKNFICAPGPTPVPSEALAAMSQPIIHHRTPQYRQILGEVHEGLKYVFCTQNDVYVLTSSGTGGMEAAVVNLLSPGDKAIVVRGGKFGERWGEICERYGVNIVPIDCVWGEPVDPKAVEEALRANPDAKCVFTTLCETSTGVVNDIKTLASIVSETDAVLVVDAVSGLGAEELRTDEWGVNVVVAGSQKALMIPPGLAFISLDDKAWSLAEKASLPKYYFDLKAARKSYEKTDTPFTSGISLVIALRETLRMIKEETLEGMLARHSLLAEATRAAVKALGLELFAKAPSNVVTAVKAPDGIDGSEIPARMRDVYGVTIAGGQAHLKGKIFRIAHLGYMNQFDVIIAIAALEEVLRDLGYEFKPGAGVAAAQEVFLKSGR